MAARWGVGVSRWLPAWSIAVRLTGRSASYTRRCGAYLDRHWLLRTLHGLQIHWRGGNHSDLIVVPLVMFPKRRGNERTIRRPGRGGEIVGTPISEVRCLEKRARLHIQNVYLTVLVHTGNLCGRNDGNRHKCCIWYLGPNIALMIQVLHHRVDHDKSGYHPIGVHWLLRDAIAAVGT